MLLLLFLALVVNDQLKSTFAFHLLSAKRAHADNVKNRYAH
jgi:hypothetical protein